MHLKRNKDMESWNYKGICKSWKFRFKRFSNKSKKKAFPKQGKGEGVLLKDLSADEAAQVIVNKLQEKYII